MLFMQVLWTSNSICILGSMRSRQASARVSFEDVLAVEWVNVQDGSVNAGTS
jgi:hypothetical protein